MYHQFKDLADVDITKQPMEVGPTAHYAMGGIRVDPETGASTVAGLYAAGECTGGMNGANRLGGNSLSDLLVFGRRAGMGAAEFARKNPQWPSAKDEEIESQARRTMAPFERRGDDPYSVHAALQDVMGKHVGIFRSENDLQEGLRELLSVRERIKNTHVEGSVMFNPGWHLARDLENLVVCAEATCRSAMLRKESRGAHSRTDFPKEDPQLAKVNMCVKKSAEGMTVNATPCPTMPEELRKLLQ
jgi:succinate dehydrogenase / fumarate reductase flavoprotein subunit